MSAQRELRIAPPWHGEIGSRYYVVSVDPRNEESWHVVETFRDRRAAEQYLRELEEVSR